MLRRISLGSVGLVVGGILTIVGFAAYATGNPTLNLVGFFYGIPILLGGLALKAAELPPVNYSQETTPEVAALKTQQATSTQQQILKDVTRFRYGQSVHLDSSLEHLGLSPNDTERPDLVGIRETAVDGAYTLVLEFDTPFLPFETWQAKQEKMEAFFGPGLRVELEKLSDEEVAVSLIATPEAPVNA
jgi:Protein of unknown function (DUF2854)